MDRQAPQTAVQILQDAKRPLIVVPEGVITRTNDRLVALMEGTSFIARAAAKRRAETQPPGQVVVHPVAIRLADMYLIQQMSHYPPEYIKSNQTPERMLETVERFEEDLTDVCRKHGPLVAKVQVGEAIPVSATRDRGATEDPLMAAVEASLRSMLENLAASRE